MAVAEALGHVIVPPIKKGALNVLQKQIDFSAGLFRSGARLYRATETLGGSSSGRWLGSAAVDPIGKDWEALNHKPRATLMMEPSASWSRGYSAAMHDP